MLHRFLYGMVLPAVPFTGAAVYRNSPGRSLPGLILFNGHSPFSGTPLYQRNTYLSTNSSASTYISGVTFLPLPETTCSTT